MDHFKGKQFQEDVIIVAVGYYLRYHLSYREVQEILYDRGINVCHTTIYRWVREYGKVLYQIWKKKNRQSFYSWKMDETYIKIKGKWHYLYRAIDADGLTLNIWLRKKRNTQAAYAFLKRLKKQFGEPKVLVTDKAPSIGSAFKKLQKNGFYLKQNIERLNISIISLNKIIVQLNVAVNFTKASVRPPPRLRAWKPFEEYIKKAEKKEISSAFQSVRKLKF